MDNFVRHVAHLPRRFGTRLRIGTIGYVPQKRDRVSHAFMSCNFSFILSGHGSYGFGGREWAVESPCVITQWPGIEYSYGPSDGDTWEELFLIYDASQRDLFESGGIYKPEQPIWYVGAGGLLRKKFRELLGYLSGDGGNVSVDRLDIMCEGMIVESLLGESSPPLSDKEAVVRRVCSLVSGRFLENHDFDSLARENGISASTLRKHWRGIYDLPPGKYVMRLRLMEACRLLVETDYSIGRIADMLGFRDPLYFSRRFREDTGSTASEYREQNRYR
ncbi:MAG: helix-turn-helix transcriptional regulator [Victivallales bacterium]|nr:helix-turn-helix transcriptional regulator [Victivallales bacterium]